MRRSSLLAVSMLGIGCAVFGAVAVGAQEPPRFSAEGYRISHYRSPTPATAPGARTLDTDGVRQLLATTPDTVLVDVYGRQWLFGRFIDDQPHANLPGSLWLANTGDGELERRWARYFEQGLARATGDDTGRPLLFYCRSDCWLGWNAVKRARSLGYERLYWYRDGIDGWQQAGLPLVPATPEPMIERIDDLRAPCSDQPHHNHNKEVNGDVQDPDCRRPSAVSRSHP